MTRRRASDRTSSVYDPCPTGAVQARNELEARYFDKRIKALAARAKQSSAPVTLSYIPFEFDPDADIELLGANRERVVFDE